MRRAATGFVAIALVATSAVVLRSQQGSGGAASGDRPPVAKAEYERWKTELSNWGRWGKDDEIGALNLITPAKRRQAASRRLAGVIRLSVPI